MPPEVQRLPDIKDTQSFELSPDAISFLLKLARHAYQENSRPIKSDSDSTSDIEECLTAEALRWIFATALSPGESHPWSDPPTYKVKSAIVISIQCQDFTGHLYFIYPRTFGTQFT